MNAAKQTPTRVRARLRTWVDGTRFNNAIILVIVVNSIVLGLQTSPKLMASTGDILEVVDLVCLAIFVVELALRFYAHGLSLLKDPWGLFDIIVVGVAIVPGAKSFAVLRALRITRALRLVSRLPTMRIVVEAMVHALPGLGATAGLLALCYYVFGVMATTLFGEAFPQWFGSIGSSCYTLFQIMTLESWSMGIVREVMKPYPHAWVMFIPYIIITSLIALNLVVAIIVDSMQSAKDAIRKLSIRPPPPAPAPAATTATLDGQELVALRREIEQLRRDMKRMVGRI